ncbi:carbohydrate-binding domain-containing protein [Romboutsia weinsteinii]|uniref:Carbohydrate-binding domain-containing protein n=1 Tax=Romboutsia weinsteinii TaxID=2020949 RepID=A0A371J6T7_9FIRM|nr:carbohydrate-binding domain-containing protein [Romboutsia weinsteinii]RDY28491.1 carbohydrate-binding domain-containing protein [Romboutsia weinsteinii]
MNKKLITMISALSLCVSVAACSKKNDTSKTENTTGSSVNIESMKSESIGDADTFIKLGSEISIEGEGARVENNKVKITSAGTYSISGKLENGQIIVNAGDEDKVYIILNGVDITSSNSAPIYALNSKKLIIALQKGTENNITDGEEYIFEDESSDEPNASIFSKDDIVIIGEGKLTVNGNYNHGIVSKDKLKIQSGNITINANNDGIKGKDCINITDGDITINSQGDGIQSNNTTDETKGYVFIEGGKLNITSGEDGIQAETQVLIKDGDITINSGGGSENSTKSNGSKGDRSEIPNQDVGEMPVQGEDMGERPEMPEISNQQQPALEENVRNNEASDSITEETVSTKAIKAISNIVIEGGNIEIDSCDDSIHSNNSITISGGTMNIASGDDGIHSDAELNINGGTINITKSYEGLESEVININDGSIHLVASDDGINATETSTESSENTQQTNKQNGASQKAQININGGYTYVDASGDGIDSNGNITMKDGTLIVNGPTNNGNGSLDYDGIFDISGGTLIASGSAGMVQTPSSSSSQKALNISLTSQEAGNIINIQSEDGKEILTFAPAKQYQSVIVSTPDIESNKKYAVLVGGSSTGKSTDGVYSEGKHSGGTIIKTEAAQDTITNITQEGATTGGGVGGPKGQGQPCGQGDRKEMKNPSDMNTTKQ